MLLTGTQVAVQLNNVDVYGDSLVLLVQRSNFQTPKRLEAGAELFKYWCHRPWTFKVYSIKYVGGELLCNINKGMTGHLEEYLKTPKKRHSLG